MNKIIVLYGPMASGKTTIAKALEGYGFERIVTATTRPKRDNEWDGFDYIFMSNSQFLESYENDEFIEIKSYVINSDTTWFYGTFKKTFDLNKKQVIVLTEDGIDELINYIGKEHLALIKINCLLVECFNRAINRGDNVDEVIRRLNNYIQRDFGHRVIPDLRIDNSKGHTVLDAVKEILKWMKNSENGPENIP